MVSNTIFFPLFYSLILIICLFEVSKLQTVSNNGILHFRNVKATFLVAIFFVLFIGTRDYTAAIFSDTREYASWYGYAVPEKLYSFSFNREWFWFFLMNLCQTFRMSTGGYICFISAIYIFVYYFALYRIFQNSNLWIAFLFFIGSFSTLAYGVNGLRNGVSTAIFTLALSFFLDKNLRSLIIGILLSILAMGCHKTIMLPLFCALLSLYLKSFKVGLFFWIASFFISLVLGNWAAEFFSGLGFDERMNRYVNFQTNSDIMSKFSHTGFRFDFLIYSAIPIVFSWYILLKKKIQDSTFLILSNTYVLANAFWVIVIRAAYSNRFAYLSWFLYPIVMAYPLLKINIWKRNQSVVAGNILLIYISFTYFMNCIIPFIS